MTMDEFDNIFTAIVAACNEFDEHAWYAPTAHTREVMAHDQGILIQTGNMIEKLGYVDAPVIRTLEQMCEDMYQQLYGDLETRIHMLPQLKRHLKQAVVQLRALIPGDALSIVSIVKNETDDLKEWLEFHRMMGVSHFYLYDNESEDGLKDLLQPYIDEGIVTYIWWPGIAAQLPAYNDAVANYKDRTRYMAMIDADEFLFPAEDEDLLDVIDDIYTLRFRAGCIGVNWREYGSSGYGHRADGLLTETHFYRGKDDYAQNAHVKAVCNPRKVRAFVNPHFPDMKDGSCMITETGTVFYLAFCCESPCKRLRINHYYIKSRDEFYAKLRRGWPDQRNFEKRDEDIAYSFALYDSGLNEVYDPVMERYLPGLRQRLGMEKRV